MKIVISLGRSGGGLVNDSPVEMFSVNRYMGLNQAFGWLNSSESKNKRLYQYGNIQEKRDMANII